MQPFSIMTHGKVENFIARRPKIENFQWNFHRNDCKEFKKLFAAKLKFSSKTAERLQINSKTFYRWILLRILFFPIQPNRNQVGSTFKS